MIQAQLNTLQENIRRKQELEDLILQWQPEVVALSRQAEELHAAMLLEQSDVEKLEAGGIGTVFHKLTGRMEEKLDKERMEAKSAAEEYRAAADALQEVQTRLADAQSELESLQDSRETYIQLMQSQIRQTESLLAAPDSEGRTEELKVRLQLQRRRKSLREALLESAEAIRAAAENKQYLLMRKNTPETEGTLQNMEALAQYLVEELTDLQAKLAQMGIDPGPHLSVGPYLRAPSAYIVGRPSDLSQKDQIANAIEQIDDLSVQVLAVEDKLREALSQVEALLPNE